MIIGDDNLPLLYVALGMLCMSSPWLGFGPESHQATHAMSPTDIVTRFTNYL